MADTDWNVTTGTQQVTLATAGTYVDRNIIVAPQDVFVKSGSGAAAGLVPAPSTTAGTTKYLREDGTWQVPPDNNTWRSIQDNLTSTSTTDSLSANQGRVLNNKVEDAIHSGFEGTPLLTTTFTTAANTSYYEAFTVTPNEALTYPVEPILVKIECSTLRSGTTYKSLIYSRISNLSNLNMTNVHFTWSTCQNTSYAPSYIRCYYPSTASNYATYPLKICVRNNTSDITSATYTISVYRIPDGFTNLTAGTGSIVTTTNYSGGSEQWIDGNGLQESADNDTTTLNQQYKYFINGSTIKLTRYAVFGFDRDDKAQGISIYETSSTGQTSISTSRVYNTAGIDYTKGLYYLSNGTTYATSAGIWSNIRMCDQVIDFRYSDNDVSASNGSTTLTFNYNKYVYLRGIIKSDGLFYLAPMSVTYNNTTYQRCWTQDIPTAVESDSSGNRYVYWLVGMPYPDGNPYRIGLAAENPLYWYNNGHFEEYSYHTFGASGTNASSGMVPAPSTTAGTTKYLREDGTWQVPPDNNTTYTAATTSAAGLMSASDKSKLDGIASGATAVTSATVSGWGFKTTDNNTTYTLTQDASDGHKITLTPSSGSATTITIPDNNTTYSSKTAASGGTDVSLVTTGEKYTWNNKSNLTIGTTATTAAAGNHTHSGYLTSSSTLDATKLSGTVPSSCYTNTTYSSKTAASGGTDVSLVTTGEKYTWNNKSDLTIGTTSTTAAAGNHTHSQYLTSSSTLDATKLSGTVPASSITTVSDLSSNPTSTNPPTAAAVVNYIKNNLLNADTIQY